MTSPTQRSLKKLRKEGWLVAVTERWNQFSRTRADLYGFIDLLAIKGNETMAVQTTSGDHVAERIAKIKGLQSHEVWLSSPTRTIMVHGWAKRGERGKRKLWTCREERVTA